MPAAGKTAGIIHIYLPFTFLHCSHPLHDAPRVCVHFSAPLLLDFLRFRQASKLMVQWKRSHLNIVMGHNSLDFFI